MIRYLSCYRKMKKDDILCCLRREKVFMMTYENARKFIEETSKTGSVLGLESICNLMEELGNVQDTLPIIHIAGTNGKGSVGAYLQAIFEKAGLTTARYCSPAVFDPLEVWQYCGMNISKEEYANVMSQVKDACDILISKGKPMPTVFEVETAAAFVWFSMKKPDVVLLEVGMGGETDATNLITKPLASVITTISRDHMGFLGEAVEEIAKVKAGIIKDGCKVFSAAQVSEVEAVLREAASQKQVEIVFVEDGACRILSEQPGCLKFSYKDVAYITAMAGAYQVKNAALAIEVAEGILAGLLGQKGKNDIAEKDKNKKFDDRKIFQEGIRNARWPGRFEVICQKPLFMIDGAHNEDAAKQLANTVANCFGVTKLTYIIGVLADKEHEKMLKRMLPYANKVFTVTPNNSRALDGAVLAEEVRKYHNNVVACTSIEDAVKLACKEAVPILAFGSLSYLGELKSVVSKD